MSANVTTATQSVLQLQLASKYLSLIFALPLFIVGVLGNLLNILVFITLGNYKHNASSLYVFCKSFFDLTALVIGLGLRVLSHGFRIDFSLRSRPWCKMRGALLEIGVFNSFTCLCLQSIDAFFCSSQSAPLRQKSNIRTARWILTGFLSVWIAHQTPYIILQDLVNVRGTPSCRTTSTIFTQYRNYFVIVVLAAIIPITVMIVFGLLTYRQLHKIEKINIDCRRGSVSLSHLTRQMTHMTLFQIFIVSLCQAPFVVAQVYSCATESLLKNALRQAQEQVAQMVIVTFSYGTFAVGGIQFCQTIIYIISFSRVHSIAIV
jgi:hypothetical protein